MEYKMKIVVLLICYSLVITALVLAAREKKYIQVFPVVIQKDKYRDVRIITILNILAAVILVFSAISIKTNIFYVITMLAAFLSIGSINALFETMEPDKDND